MTAPHQLRRRGAALVVALALVVAACSSSDSDAGADDGEAPDAAVSADAWERPTCDLPEAATADVAAAPVAGVASDVDVTSFDGTVIRAHWFPVAGATPEAPAPTVLMGPGWGQPGDTNTQAVGVLGALNIASLWTAGYNVLTWDPRGFGASTGLAMVDSVDFEARDVQALLTWLATQPQAAVDAEGDPTSGMIGGSYGGGIQLVTAAVDCRVDALVPVIAWNSLGTSLYKDETFKQGWAGILSQVAGDSVDPHVVAGNTEGLATGVLSPDVVEWFLDRGPGDLVGDIGVPTLLVGGTVDTLFTLDEDVANYALLGDAGVPAAMFWFCGGHGVCLTDPGDPQPMQTAMISWLDRYVKGDRSVDTGPAFTFVDQEGTLHAADGYPPAGGDPVEAGGSGTLELVPDGGAGPATIPAGNTDLLAGLVGPITPSPAANAVSVDIPVEDEAMIVGTPELTVTYSGTAPAGDRPTRVFAQIVDPATGLVLGNQITPVPVTLDGESHEATVPLEVVAHHAAAGSTLTLQLVATTPAYAQPRLGGSVELTDIRISLPVVTGTTPAG